MRSNLVVLALVLACGCNPSTGPGRDGGGGGGGDLAGGGGGGGGDDGGVTTLGCSADLQNVTDGSGNVIQMCPSDQGCYQGQCIPACDAAAMSKGNVGCDFMTPTPSFEPQIAPPCFAAFVANNWSKPVMISVSRGGMSYDVTKFGRIASTTSADATTWQAVPSTGLPPGQVAVLFLSSDPTSSNVGFPLKCPVTQAAPGSTQVSGSGKGQAWSIKTDVPVSAYDIMPYGGATSFLPSAELLLPTSAWGTNYVAVVSPKKTSSQHPNSGPQWGQIVASQDATMVQINPVTSLPGGNGAPAASANQVTTFMLNAGEYVQWQDSGEMSGSIISSDKPVSFIGGNGYLCLPSAMTTSQWGGCDSGHQMVPPISALGSEYAGSPFVTRRKDLAPESVLYRFVGLVDGTTLTYDPPTAAAPPTLARGTVKDFETTTPFVVKSQDSMHPFYVAQMMPGALLNGGSRPGATVNVLGSSTQLGDEEFVNILPPAQFLSKYVFFTDPTYSTTNLVLTRVKQNGAFADVNVDCLGKVSGWQPLGAGGTYEYAQVDLVRAKVGVGTCTNGPHEADSQGPFGLMVWGTDTFSSYAYPGGGNVGTITTVVINPIP